MRPNVVVDVGNSRIKWGLCDADSLREICSLPHDDPESWMRQLQRWKDARGLWVVSGVHPQSRDQLIGWLRERGQRVQLLEDPNDLPLHVLLEQPDHVGVDRLLDAVAANSRRKAETPAIVIDAGSAVTVDLIDTRGAFSGGAILPGMRLMAKALHDYTALLPLLAPPEIPPAVPGGKYSRCNGIGDLLGRGRGRYTAVAPVSILMQIRNRYFSDGGDGPRLHPIIPKAQLWPEMTLEGIRLSAEALP